MGAEKNAVLAVFMLSGVLLGSWAPRVPAIAEHVHAESGSLGLALFGASIGLILAASVAGRLCARFGARRLVLIAAVGASAALPLLALAPSVLVLGLVLSSVGVTMGALDVAMNIAAVTVVRRTERPLMPVLHAGFSVGALTGAGGSAVAAAHRWAPLPHFLVVATLSVLVVCLVITRVPNEPAVSAQRERRSMRSLARRPVLWLLAAVVFCSAVAEGASADWSALFAVRQRGFGEASAAIVYAVYSVAMAVTRLLGERAERRWGPKRLLVAGAVTGAGGLLLAVLIPAGWAAYAGFALAGAGLAYAFPVGLGLAGAVGRRPDGSGGEHEIGFVTMIAYGGFLLGPPMIGGIAQLTNLAVALGVAGVIAALIAPAALTATRARRREERAAADLAPDRTAAVSGT